MARKTNEAETGGAAVAEPETAKPKQINVYVGAPDICVAWRKLEAYQNHIGVTLHRIVDSGVLSLQPFLVMRLAEDRVAELAALRKREATSGDVIVTDVEVPEALTKEIDLEIGIRRSTFNIPELLSSDEVKRMADQLRPLYRKRLGIIRSYLRK